jgi:hypothetical protein
MFHASHCFHLANNKKCSKSRIGLEYDSVFVLDSEVIRGIIAYYTKTDQDPILDKTPEHMCRGATD